MVKPNTGISFTDTCLQYLLKYVRYHGIVNPSYNNENSKNTQTFMMDY